MGGIAGSAGGGAIGTWGTQFGTTQGLSINRSLITNNKTLNVTTTAYPGGAFYLTSPATITDSSVVSNNVVTAAVGTPAAGINAGGGAYLTKAVATDNPSLTIVKLDVSGNNALLGGGIGANSGAPISVTGNSIFSGNIGGQRRRRSTPPDRAPSPSTTARSPPTPLRSKAARST